MIKLEGKPALIVVDMQNGFLHEKGTFAKMGLHVENPGKVIKEIRGLAETFQAAGLPIFFVRYGWKADYSDSGLLLEKRPQIKEMGGFVKGTWDAEIVDELKMPGIIIDKTRNSAFFRTELEQTLVDMGVKQVFVTGVGTNICVESTVRDSFSIGFHTVTVSDATGTLNQDMHQASLGNLEWFGDVATRAEVEAILR